MTQKLVFIFAVASTLLLTSCGYQQQINSLNDRANQAELDAATTNAANELRMNQLQAQIDALNSTLNSNYTALANADLAIIASGAALASQSTQTQTYVAVLQAQQASLLSQLAVLQGYPNIVAIYNPCNTQSAADEVFLKLSNGKYLASFSDNANGNNTRFALLYDGNFTTSDGTSCKFTVSGNGTIISNEHN